MSQNIVLFDHSSDTDISDSFVVPSDGGAILLSAFGLYGEGCLIIEKLAFSGGAIPLADACAKLTQLVTEPQIIAFDSINQSGQWTMSENYNTGLLTLPGIYRVKAEDDQSIGDFLLYGIPVSKEAVPNIPSHLRFGDVTY